MEFEVIYIYIYMETLTNWYSILGTTARGLFPYLDKDLRKDGAKMLYEEFQRVKEQTRPGPRLDLDTAHIFCQWQSCLLMGTYLNQLLFTPLPEPDLTRWAPRETSSDGCTQKQILYLHLKQKSYV